MSAVVSLLYVSRSLLPHDRRQEALEDIEYTCLSRNTSLEITGILVVTRDYFTQLLEGGAEQVDAVMARIMRDPRHDRIQIIRRTLLNNRTFTTWKMVRYDVSNFGETAVAPIIAATHVRPESNHAQRLDRLLVSI